MKGMKTESGLCALGLTKIESREEIEISIEVIRSEQGGQSKQTTNFSDHEKELSNDAT
jgi:hypothetical protein